MANMNEEKIGEVFAPHLQEGETIQHVAFGIKQPNIFLIILLICLAILPGLIAVALLSKNYLVAITDKRFIAVQIKGFSNPTIKELLEYDLATLNRTEVTTSVGSIFTHIKIDRPEKKFVAKFHRAYSKFNRPNTIAICAALTGQQAA